jgi:hypothetical protein
VYYTAVMRPSQRVQSKSTGMDRYRYLYGIGLYESGECGEAAQRLHFLVRHGGAGAEVGASSACSDPAPTRPPPRARRTGQSSAGQISAAW